MDSFAIVTDSSKAPVSASGLGNMAETLICVAVAMVVLRLELQRRAGTGPDFGSREGSRYAENAKRILRQCAPEGAALIAVLTLAAALRARGDSGQPQDEEAWARITSQWPLLVTADTLLSLQAMLRLVVLLSVALRAGMGGPVPLSEETAALWLGGGLARAAILARSTVYMFDGPLGGKLPAACEIAVLPLLFILARGIFRRVSVTVALVLGGVVLFAYRNRLCLAEDPVADTLFMVAHSFDFLAAFAYLLRGLLIENCPRGSKVHIATGFTHALMPIQQSLATYYFLQAFDAVPDLIASGLPFEVLQISNTAQLGLYLGSAALYIAECFESPMLEAGHTPTLSGREY